MFTLDGIVDSRQRLSRTQRLAREVESTLLTEGFLHIGIDELARRMRCSKRNLYELAGSREELVQVIIGRYLSRIRVIGNMAVANANNWTEAIEGYVDAAVEGAKFASSKFLDDMAKFPPARRQMRLHQVQRIAGLEILVSAGVRERAFSAVDAKLFAAVMIHMSNLMIDPDFLRLVHRSLSDACAQMYRLLLEGLLHREVADRSSRLASKFLSKRSAISKRLWRACPATDASRMGAFPTRVERFSRDEIEMSK